MFAELDFRQNISLPITMTSNAQRNVRNRNLRRALSTAVVARAAGLLLQVFSLPIAAAALGVHGFSVYSMITAVLSWLTLSNLGIGQAATLQMSSESSLERRRAIFFSSWALMLGTATIALMAAFILASFTPLLRWLFSGLTLSLASLYAPLLLVGVIFLVAQALSIFEAAQLAEQQQDQANVAAALGTAVAAVLVYWAAQSEPSVFLILAAVHLPVLGARMVNAIRFGKKFGLSISNISWPPHDSTRSILKDGLHFVFGSTISNFLCHPFSILIVGSHATAIITASYSAVMNAVILAASVFGLLMSPLRGALPEAYSIRDHDWIKGAFRWTMVSSLGYALIPSLLLLLAGQQLFSFWYQNTVSPSRSMVAGAGVYIILLAIEVINYNFLSCLGRLGISSRWMSMKAVVSALATWLTVYFVHDDYVFWSLSIVNLFLSAIPLSVLTLKIVGSR